MERGDEKIWAGTTMIDGIGIVRTDDVPIKIKCVGMMYNKTDVSPLNIEFGGTCQEACFIYINTLREAWGLYRNVFYGNGSGLTEESVLHLHS